MKLKFLTPIVAATVLTASSLANIAHADFIDSGSHLLEQSGANLIESWVGQGDLNWSSLWYGETGATALSWHNAVDGQGPTVSIFDITYNRVDYLIGGYTDLDWNQSGSYAHDTDGSVDSFIFNLSSAVMHDTSDSYYEDEGANIIFNKNDYFATFGGGYDLFGGRYTVGGTGGSSQLVGTFNGNLLNSKGNIVTGSAERVSFTINALETFSVAAAPSSVPEPSTLAIFALTLLGLGGRRYIKS